MQYQILHGKYVIPILKNFQIESLIVSFLRHHSSLPATTIVANPEAEINFLSTKSEHEAGGLEY